MSEECEHKIHCHVVENSVEGGWGAIDATGSRGRWSVEDLTYETGATPHAMRSIESRPRWKALHWMLSLNYWTCLATMKKNSWHTQTRKNLKQQGQWMSTQRQCRLRKTPVRKDKGKQAYKGVIQSITQLRQRTSKNQMLKNNSLLIPKRKQGIKNSKQEHPREQGKTEMGYDKLSKEALTWQHLKKREKIQRGTTQAK